MAEIQRILAVSGLTPQCRSAVHYAISLARTCGAELAVVHLVAKNPFELSGGELPLDTVEHDYLPYQLEARAYLDELVADGRSRGMEIRELTRFGNPAEEVAKVVRAGGYDLLVLGSHEEGPLGHFMERGKHGLIRKLPCSILLVKGEA